jgi:hypothetical protein
LRVWGFRGKLNFRGRDKNKGAESKGLELKSKGLETLNPKVPKP